MSTLLLLSGGMDSAVCMHEFSPDAAICFDYDQSNSIETEFARGLASAYGVPMTFKMLPRIRLIDDVVYAARNAVLLSMAASHAAEHGHDTLMVGYNATDSERFPDCSEQFVRNMNDAFMVGYNISVLAPLIHMTKAEIVAKSKGLRASTWSCYNPIDGKNCGKCLACRLLED